MCQWNIFPLVLLNSHSIGWKIGAITSGGGGGGGGELEGRKGQSKMHFYSILYNRCTNAVCGFHYNVCMCSSAVNCVVPLPCNACCPSSSPLPHSLGQCMLDALILLALSLTPSSCPLTHYARTLSNYLVV